MAGVAQTILKLAEQAATKTLADAAVFADLCAPSKILFRRDMRQPGCPVVVVRLLWPGVLQVFNPRTGELLAESLPGQPMQLRPGFICQSQGIGKGGCIRNG
jgi:hypothetical protein